MTEMTEENRVELVTDPTEVEEIRKKSTAAARGKAAQDKVKLAMRKDQIRRMKDLQSRIEMGTAQVIAAIHKMPFLHRLKVCYGIMLKIPVDDYNEDGEYVGDDEGKIVVAEDIKEKAKVRVSGVENG